MDTPTRCLDCPDDSGECRTCGRLWLRDFANLEPHPRIVLMRRGDHLCYVHEDGSTRCGH